jgi:ribulose-phosphate 3-epimerase
MAPSPRAHPKIAPSILSADLSRLGEEIREVEAAGAELIHLDVMDGHFVPNLTWGPPIVAAVRPVTKLPLDVHLMITKPARYIEAFAEAGADIIGIHIEADATPGETLAHIRALGKKPCITLNPQTGLETIDHLLDQVDQVLIMSVNPGFGGQAFIPSALGKIEALANRLAQRGLQNVEIEVDGGIGPTTFQSVVDAGATILVAGAAIFGQRDRAAAIRTLKGLK